MQGDRQFDPQFFRSGLIWEWAYWLCRGSIYLISFRLAAEGDVWVWRVVRCICNYAVLCICNVPR
jgi:hypothetical protein